MRITIKLEQTQCKSEINYSLLLHSSNLQSTIYMSPASLPTTAQPLKAAKQPRLHTASSIKQQLVIVSAKSMRCITREPATENIYSRPPIGGRCTLINNKHELTVVIVISQTYVMAVCDVRWLSLNE